MLEIDHDRLAAELLRTLRGRRSQEAFRRRLGFRSNVAHLWESGRRAPTATETHRVAQRMGIDVNRAWARFLGPSAPAWLASAKLDTTEDLGRLLDTLRGGTAVAALARRGGLSHHAVRRWLRGECEVRLPDALRYLDAATQRLLDWVSEWASPADLPSVAEAWARLETARRVAEQQPWVPAILRALELEAYRRMDSPPPGWIADRLSIPLAVETECLALLERAGRVERAGAHYVAVTTPMVQLRTPGADTKRWWAQVGADRMHQGGPDSTASYAVFALSRRDHARVREVLQEAYRRVRSIVSEAEPPPDRVFLMNLQLLPLDHD